MSKPLNAEGSKIGHRDREVEEALSHARENVWEKDRAAIIKAVKRMLALRRRRAMNGHADMPEPAGQAG